MNKIDKFFEVILDNVNEGIYIVDKKGDYIFCNSAFSKMTGGSKEEIYKMNAFDLVEQGIVKKSIAVTVFNSKKKETMINNVITQKGFQYRQMATGTPIFDSEGNIEYIIIEMIILDIFLKRYQNAILVEDEETIELYIMEDKQDKENIIKESIQMKEIYNLVDNIAPLDSTVLIEGETGTGKEVLVHYIHRNSKRRRNKIIEINCAALPENLLESELFGYEKGAFTGAVSAKKGIIEDSDGGTLFLDEINSMSLNLQSKLLRVLETKKVKRIGSLEEKPIDFRLICATNQDLRECIKNGEFREDLYYRINVIPIRIPPLRERKDDIIPLAIYFLNYFCKKYGKDKAISKTAMKKLLNYSWPGNVRELKNFIERLIITSFENTVQINQIPENMFLQDDVEENKYSVFNKKIEESNIENIINYDDKDFSLKNYMEKHEKHLILDALEKYGSTYKAAKILKVNQSTVHRKKQKYINDYSNK